MSEAVDIYVSVLDVVKPSENPYSFFYYYFIFGYFTLQAIFYLAKTFCFLIFSIKLEPYLSDFINNEKDIPGCSWASIFEVLEIYFTPDLDYLNRLVQYLLGPMILRPTLIL